MFLRLLIVTGQFEKTKMLNVLDFIDSIGDSVPL